MSRAPEKGASGVPGGPEAPVASGEGVRPGALSVLLQDLLRGDVQTTGWGDGLRPGSMVGRFEIVRELGRGGFGVVYEARDTALGRSVAFKALRTPDRDGIRQDRLLGEADAAARLSHPNIVTLHDVGRCEHGPFLVLELLRGRTLEHRLEQGPIAPSEAVRVAVEVASGLAHAHAHGVVHRDLSPGNVFLCDDGQVKILDLGMAHAFGRRKIDGGTPAYMAPEQRDGAPEDERTDVFALGVLLYRMLAGELPARSSGGKRSTAEAAPELVIPGAPALGALVHRMLRRDPVRRPRDAGVVRDALSSIHQELLRGPPGAAAVRVRPRHRRGWVLAALAAGALAAGILVAQGFAQRRAASRAATAMPSIAVLPFADLSPQKDQEYFSDGLAEEILNALAQVPGLHVAGRTSSFAFKGTNADLRTIGRRLHVGTILEGSVRKVGSRVRITAQIVSLADGYHLWSQTFDRELTDVFAIQDDIARAVVAALKLKLLPAASPPRNRPTSPDAYTQYLIGKQWYARYSPEGFRRAAEAFEKAIAIDPSYAPAWAGLAVQLHSMAGTTGSQAGDEKALQERALAAAEKAVELDPDLAEGYATRGYMRAFVKWDWTAARDDVERAIALGPGDATTLRRYALVHEVIGRTGVALRAVRTATELDPLFPANWMALGRMLLRNGELREARVAFDRAREIAPDYAGIDSAAAYLSFLEGDLTGALAAYQKSRDELERLAGVAAVQYALGHQVESKAALDELIAKHGATTQGAQAIAQVYAVRGDRDAAFAWLDRGGTDPTSLFWICEAPTVAKLRADPRYTALLRKMNLPVE